MQSHKITINGNYIVSHSICHRAMCACTVPVQYCSVLYHLPALLCAYLWHSSVIHKPPDMPSQVTVIVAVAVVVDLPLLPQCHLYTHTLTPIHSTHKQKSLTFTLFCTMIALCIMHYGKSHLVHVSVWNFLSTLIVGSPHYVIGRDMCIVAIATVHTIAFHTMLCLPLLALCAIRITLRVHLGARWVDLLFHYAGMKRFHIRAFYVWRNPNMKERRHYTCMAYYILSLVIHQPVFVC